MIQDPRNPVENTPSPEAQVPAPTEDTTHPIDAAKPLNRGPSYEVPAGKKPAEQMPEDLVDEESMESFPASDPPSHTKSRA